MPRFAISLTTPSSEPLPQRLREVAAAGFDAVEMPWPSPDNLGGSSLEEFVEWVRASHIEVALLSIDSSVAERSGLPTPDAQAGADNFRRSVRSALDLAASLGCRKLSIAALGASARENQGEALEALSQKLAWAAELAEDKGITLLLETEESSRPDSLLERTRDGLRLLAQTNKPNVQLVFDLGRTAERGDDVVDSIAEAALQIGHVRLSGSFQKTEPDGEAPSARDALSALRSGGYGDVVGIERPNRSKTDGGDLVAALGGNEIHDRERLDRVQKLLASEGLDAIICVLPENVLALSGYWPMNGTCAAVVARGHEPELIVPRGEETGRPSPVGTHFGSIRPDASPIPSPKRRS